MNSVLSTFLGIFHVFLYFIMVFGIFIPDKYLIYYLFLMPGMFFQWRFNDKQCILTEIEFKVSNNHHNNIDEMLIYDKTKVVNIIKKFNIFFDNYDTFHNYMCYSAFILWIFAFIRALIYYRKDIAKDWKSIKTPFMKQFINDKYK